LTNINDPWIRIRKRVGLEDVRIHDFRRTTGAWLAQNGYSMLVVKQLLGHSVNDVTGIYARMSPRAVRKAVDDLGTQLLSAARGDDDNVVPIAAARGQG
jgi:integrase